MKSKGAIFIYFAVMLICLYFGIMTVHWLVPIVAGFIGTTLLMVYFYLMRNQDEILNRAWRSFSESWPTMLGWQRALVSFVFPVAYIIMLFAVLADDKLDKRESGKDGHTNTTIH